MTIPLLSLLAFLAMKFLQGAAFRSCPTKVTEEATSLLDKAFCDWAKPV